MPGAQQAQSPRPPPRSHTRQSWLPGAGSPSHGGGGGGVDQGDPGGPLSGDPLTPRVPQLPLTQVHEEQVVELGGGCGEVDLVGEDAHPLLKHKDDVCTQRVLQKVGSALLAAGGGGLGTTMSGGGGLGGGRSGKAPAAGAAAHGGDRTSRTAGAGGR